MIQAIWSHAWLVGSGVVLVVVAWAVLVHGRPLWRAWRKERRLIRACNDAFGEDNYRLQRLRLPVSQPSLLEQIFGLAEPPKKYYTYQILPVDDAEPDYSTLSRKEIALVRHYTGPRRMTHNGRQTIHEPAPASVDVDA